MKLKYKFKIVTDRHSLSATKQRTRTNNENRVWWLNEYFFLDSLSCNFQPFLHGFLLTIMFRYETFGCIDDNVFMCSMCYSHTYLMLYRLRECVKLYKYRNDQWFLIRVKVKMMCITQAHGIQGTIHVSMDWT